MSKGRIEVGRLAFRVEGEFWNAYWAPSQASMEGAIQLGSLRMSAAKVPARKDQFMDLMRAAFSDLAQDATGVRPGFTGARPAPERERSGSA